jgi:hypothetical protein
VVAKLTGNGGEPVDDVLDVLERFLGSWRPRGLVVVRACGAAGPRVVIVL